MLRIERLHKSFGGQKLFEGLDWFLGDRDRVGLIGRNGTGKSTLLRILAGEEDSDAGLVARPKQQTVGYLPQFGFESGPGTVVEEARSAFGEILAWKAETAEIEERLGIPDLAAKEAERLIRRHDELDHRFRQHGGYEIERSVQRVLIGLGFTESDFDRPVRSLSGGWQMRVALARLLLGQPDVLLLDEPTNHLDIEARVWLEGFLTQYPGGFVIVSHDRHFLDSVVSRITEIMNRDLIDYEGGYSRYVELRDARFDAAMKAYTRQQQEITRIQRFIDKFRADKKRASQAQSRVKMLEKMVRLEPPVPPARAIHFQFPQPEPPGRIVMKLRSIQKSYGANVVFDSVDFDLERGEKLALVGPNGAGKSTMMRILSGGEELQGGQREVGYRVSIESFAQDQADQLPTDRSILEETMTRTPFELVPRVRSLLGAFLFRGDEVEKQIKVLSGGERNRFALMLMLLRPANLLLLDEPTNHLDIEAQQVLLHALKGFSGTLVFVSHDHYFLSRLATRVIEVGDGQLRDHPGDYESYLWKKEREAAEQAAIADPKRVRSAAGSRSVPTDSRVRSKSERRRAKRLDQLESKIESLEQRRLKLEGLMATDGFFRDAEKSQFYLKEHREILDELNSLYDEWHGLQDDSDR